MVATTIQEALRDWSWLSNFDSIEVLRTTCLGDVIFKNSEGKELILVLVAGEIRDCDANERDWVANEGGLIARLELEGLKLGPGQCYGLKPYAIFKDYAAENMYVATLPEYVSFMGNFHEQTKDLPDGTKVRFKVINFEASE